ncbi:MAG: head decoration protein [SAR324 cluster bacterium]|nr:head decoration protein [SAR324 cluster bacterium]
MDQISKQIKTIFAADNYGPVTEEATLTGGPYVSGQVLGLITASDKYTAYSDIATDGSEVASAILIEDADASAADMTAVVGKVGVLVEANLTGLDAAAKADLTAAHFFFK